MVCLLVPALLFSGTAAAIVWDGLHDEVAPADVAIVLGAQVWPNGQPALRLKARLDKTVALYQQGLFPAIIVSGGLGASGYNEAEVMKQYLVAHGVPAAQIITDSGGNNTALTAQHAARLMDERGMRSALVISQYFHLSRARLALNRCGVTPVYTAHAPYFGLRDLYSIPREVIGFYVYWLGLAGRDACQ
jgi:vancomycin permeability regulator SanA